MSRRILVVDDDKPIAATLKRHLSRSGFETWIAESAEEALSVLSEADPDLVITDICMPGMDGLDLLERIRGSMEEVDVIVITAFEDMPTAIRAMKGGAYDYLVKPLDLDQIDHLVERCFRERKLRSRMQRLSDDAAAAYAPDQLVGRDPKMIEIYKIIGVLAENRTTVLVTGETGTGKELVARAIHYSSTEADEPFVAVNCTALPGTLLESELFGHVKGAFTGAVQSRKGYFELAGAGTIFLDEIGGTSPEFQARLLRVLEQREFFPVGSEHLRRTEARVVAATQKPLGELVRSGSFRDDLHFRLRVMEIHLPPLRDRRGDVPILADHLLARIGRDLHQEARVLSDEAVGKLVEYDWPGNVRELENALTRAAVLSRGPVITPQLLRLDAAERSAEREGEDKLEAGDKPGDTLADAERAQVQRILNRTEGNKRQAARILDISRSRLDRLIEKHGIVVPNRGQDGPGS
jgi:two-component system response regulator AtoC